MDINEEPLEERNITVKRKYTENHPARTVGKAAKIRNKVLEAIKDGKISQEEFKSIVKEMTADSTRWLRRNTPYFNVSEDGISLSKTGMRILKSITPSTEVTLNEKWLSTAKQLTDYAFDHFYEPEKSMFYFTSDEDQNLITRKMEIEDNVIPASNSIMAKNLFLLSHYYSNSYYLKVSQQMLHNVKDRTDKYASGYSNWLQLACNFTGEFYEIAISGKEASEKIKEINKNYIPNKLIAGSISKSRLPLMEGRFSENETYTYVCVDGACLLPVKNTKKALSQLKITF